MGHLHDAGTRGTFKPDQSSYSCIINAYESVGHDDKVEEWFARMHADNLVDSMTSRRVPQLRDCQAVIGEPQCGMKVPVKVMALRNTHNRLQPRFSCGRRVQDVVEDLHLERLAPAELPIIISVVQYMGKWYSANNRRLYASRRQELKQLKQWLVKSMSIFYMD